MTVLNGLITELDFSNNEEKIFQHIRACWNGNEEVLDERKYQFEHFKNSNFFKTVIRFIIEGEIASMGIGIQNFSCEHFLDLGWISTKPEFEGKGLARKLMTQLENKWKEAKITEYPNTMLSCLIEHEEFYKKLGYQTLYNHKPTSCLMIKKLS